MAVILFLPIALAFATPAGAITLTNPDGSRAEPYSTWADAARVPTVDDTFFIAADMNICGSAFADAADACITQTAIALRPSCSISRKLNVRRRCRFYFWHELGHAFAAAMPDWKRARFNVIMGRPADQPWTQTTDRTLGGTEEDFADSYALCAIGKPILESVTVTALTDSQYRRICRLIRQPN